MANVFDQFDAADRAYAAAQNASQPPVNVFDQFDAADRAHAASQGSGTLNDVVMSTETGIVKGAAEMAMLPLTVPKLIQSGAQWLADKGFDAIESGVRGIAGWEQRPAGEADRLRAEARSRTDVIGNAQDAVRGYLDQNTHKPQTVPGQYAETLGEFAGGGLLTAGTVPQRIAQVAIPAIASETAGQATKGTALEPWARGGAAIIGGLGTAALQARSGGKAMLGEAMEGISESDFNAARALQADGAARGVDLTLGEALNQVTGGRAGRVSQLERVVANNGGSGAQRMTDLYAARPGQVENTARSVFDEFGPTSANPHTLGPQVGEVAEGIVGDAMSARTQAVSPMYQAAATDTVDPATVQRLVKGIDDLIARDATGLTHGPLNSLKSSLIAKPATPGTPSVRTPVTDPKTGRVVRYDHTPSTPGTPAVLIDDVENLDRVRKFYRDQTDLPQFAANAIDKETGALIIGKTSALDRAMEAASSNYAAGRETYRQITRQDIEPLLAGPIGQIAKRDITTAQAIDALFPENPLPGSAPQTLEAVKALSNKSPALANHIVRAYVERVFNNAAKELIAGPNVNGGAKFVANLKGNSEQAANLAAAIQGLKNGDDILPGFDKFLDVLQSTGWKPPKGSDTAFNQQIQKQLTGGAGTVSGAVQQASMGGIKLPKLVSDKWDAYRMGRNTEELARILTDPKAVPVFKALGTTTPGTAKAAALAARLTYFGQKALEKGNNNN